MAVDRDRHHGAAAVRLRLSRPQGPYADAEGGGRMVRGLRRDCDPLRAGHVDPWWSVDGNGELRRLCDGEGTLGRQPVRLPHHHDQLRGAASRPTEGLLFGIVFSIIARTGFIFLGATLINTFSWVFYLFGLILLLTAGHMLKPEGEDSHSGDNIMVRIAQKLFHTTDRYDGDKLFTVENDRKVMTPMVLVMAAIAGTDILFALDSIPAIYGLTENVYIVFTATVFSLLGLRQLFFLIDGLLDRLVYLSYGLAAILGFIGIKLILHALHENNVPFINGGEPVDVVEVSTGLSLSVIIGALLVTVVASLISPKGRAQNAVTNARRHATQYLDLSYEADQRLRERTFEALLQEEQIIRGLPEKYRRQIRDEHELMDLLHRAHAMRDERVAAGYGSSATPRVAP